MVLILLESVVLSVAIMLWTKEQREFIIQTYFSNDNRVIATQRAFRTHFKIPSRAPIPSRNSILKWVNRFQETGSAERIRNGSQRTSRTPENVERVLQSYLRYPRLSARKRAALLGISDRTIRRIFHSDLKFKLNDLDKPDYNDYDEDDDVTALEVKDEPLSDGEFVEYDDVKMEEPDDLVIEEKYHTHSENTNHHHNDDNDVKVKLPIEICSVLPNGTSSSSSIKSEHSLSSSSPSSSNQIIIDNVSASMNEFVIFGKNVATQLRQMKIVNALEAQAQISALLTHYRLKQLKGTLLKSEGLPVLVLPQNKM